MEPDTDSSVYCRVCRRALSVLSGPGGQVKLVHAAETRGQQVDHRPDPIPLAELADPIVECDFCSGPAAVVYRLADQQSRLDPVTLRVVGRGDYQRRHQAARALRTETGPRITTVWGSRWTACRGCAEHIDNGDLPGLITRVTASMPAKHTRGRRLPQVRGLLHGLYSGLFEGVLPHREPLPGRQQSGGQDPPNTITTSGALAGGHDDTP